MKSSMMAGELLISSLIVHADCYHGDTEIVSRRVEGDIHRYTYRDCHRRARRMANALAGLGVRMGERVATLAWNGYRHMELYYAISGSGAVMHTVNPRLHPDQIAYIVNHAQDQFLFFDLNFLPLVKLLAGQCPNVRGFVAMASPADMPDASGIPNLLCYETLVDGASDGYRWPVFDEETACTLCYTSGTTGNPKGVLYSHRSTLLHTYAAGLPDALDCSARDVVLPVVPMFHVNAWGIPYIACMMGTKLVFPGPALDGPSLYGLLEAEGVTLSAGVPAVWQGLLAYMEQGGKRFSTMRRTVVGGSACPPAMLRAFQEVHGVEVLHAWGMTELSPLGTVCRPKARHRDETPDERLARQARQGRPGFGVDLRIIDGDGLPLPWDGASCGELLVRGPWIADSYFGDEPIDMRRDDEGRAWFATGDVGNIDRDGYLQITDRSKDVIKSGGEWISSIELENVALEHPAVFAAACIAMPHPKWDERPLLLVVKKPGAFLERAELLTSFEGKVARWWMPDDVVFVDTLPLGATGKVLKGELRKRYADRGSALA